MSPVIALAQKGKVFLLSSAIIAVLGLSACGGGGGGGGGGGNGDVTSASNAEVSASDSESAYALAVLETKPTSKEAARFLTQATFGPTTTSTQHLMDVGYGAWLKEQFAEPRGLSYQAYWDSRNTALRASNTTTGAHSSEIDNAFWAKALIGTDQLRQRVVLALSEIFVISLQDGCGDGHPRGVANYLDMLNAKAFGTYRDLLQAVALHPVMGCYLSHLRNQGEDVLTGRVPDENFAREVMQLFSIGLIQLNPDGTPKLDATGKPLETYNAADVSGLAKVFTGWSWDCPYYPSDSCFKFGGDRGATLPDKWSVPMRAYPKYHSKSEKRFLSTVIPAESAPNPENDLKIALDTLANHPNVGPFIGKQLIQRLVTSNPSPDYIRRVATAFTKSGGSLQATVQAVLMDQEARNYAGAQSIGSFGKLREPILRFSALLRAYGARSSTGSYLISNTNNPGYGLGQGPLQAPSVFNYFRPGYTPPGSSLAAANLVAPESQIIHETSVAGYANFMRDTLSAGVGAKGYDNLGSVPDVRLDHQINPDSSINRMAANPAALVEDANQKLLYGSMTQTLRSDITNAITSIYNGSLTNQSAVDRAETARKRVMATLLLIMVSPEFYVQR